MGKLQYLSWQRSKAGHQSHYVQPLQWDWSGLYLSLIHIYIQEEAKQLISKAIHEKQQQVGDVLRDSMKMLADITNCTTVMMLDNNKSSALQLLQLLLVEPGKALMVIITDGDKIENRFLEIPKTMTKEDLELVSMMINQNLRGLKVGDWQHNILENIFQNLTRQRQVVRCV